MNKKCKRRVLPGLCLCFGLFSILTGVLLPVLVQRELDDKLKKVMPLKPGAYTYDPWRKPPLPIHFNMYVFHLENPLEVINEGAKPVFTEKGPYVYRVKDEKKNITFHPNNTVSYQEFQDYIFDRDLSAGDATDKFTTINLPLITAATLIQNEYQFIKDMMKMVFDLDKSYSLFTELSVHDIVWGYEDPFLKLVKALLAKFNIPYDDRFGFFLNVNGSDNGVFNVDVGNDLNKLAVIDRWKGQRSLSIWNTDTCNMINGTDGNLYHPYIKKSERLDFFYTQIQRSLYLLFDKEVSSKGIDLYRFRMPDDVFFSPEKNPQNEGFCVSKTCLPSGFLDINRITHGSPTSVSQPHFLGADPGAASTVGGLAPDRNKHGTYIEMEPTLGVVMNSHRPIQINAVLTNISVVRQTWKLKNTVHFPIIWFGSMSTLTDDLANSFKSSFVRPLKIVSIAHYACYGIGAVILVCSIIVIVRMWKKYKQISPKDEMNGQVNVIADERTPLIQNQDVES